MLASSYKSMVCKKKIYKLYLDTIKNKIDMGDLKYWIKNCVMKGLKKKEVELTVVTYSPH
jgi:Asp-tRNA(Asn)/Glu-tRNA(Gln) amidotransferase B subunit